MFSTISKEDISDVLRKVDSSTWSELQNARIFLTGGTGFIGTWLLECLLAADTKLGLGLSITLLSRTPRELYSRFPSLKDETRLEVIQGNVTSFDFPKARNFTHMVHAGNLASLPLTSALPLEATDTIINGTRRVLEFALMNPIKDLLLTSSGAVYGRCPEGMNVFKEDSLLAPNPLEIRSIYGESKRLSEMLCASFSVDSALRPKIARIFALTGPYLPLDTHFAMGNFIRDARQGQRIHILSDGRPVRSYLYASDLMVWLFKIWLKGKALVPYHVGSEIPFSLQEVANHVVQVFEENQWAEKGQIKIEVAKKPNANEWVDRYVPETKNTRQSLGLEQSIDLKTAIQKTANWYIKNGN